MVCNVTNQKEVKTRDTSDGTLKQTGASGTDIQGANRPTLTPRHSLPVGERENR